MKNLFAKCQRKHYTLFVFRSIFAGLSIFLRLFANSVSWAIHLSQNMRKWLRNAKNKKCMAGYFVSLFSRFAPLLSLFAFRSISHEGWHLCEKSMDFVVYLFAALIKHKIRMKYEKYRMSVCCILRCFAKNPQNAKYIRKIYSRPWDKFLNRSSIMLKKKKN